MKKLAYLLLAVLTAMLLFDDPGVESQRIFRELLNIGHFVLFAGLGLVVLKTPFMRLKPYGVQLAWLSLGALASGGSVTSVSRTPSPHRRAAYRSERPSP